MVINACIGILRLEMVARRGEKSVRGEKYVLHQILKNKIYPVFIEMVKNLKKVITNKFTLYFFIKLIRVFF